MHAVAKKATVNRSGHRRIGNHDDLKRNRTSHFRKGICEVAISRVNFYHRERRKGIAIAILDLINLKKTYESSGAPLFAGVCAHIAEPSVIALLGTSGQGKSTLLRMLCLLEAPDDGDIRLQGASYTNSDPRLWRMKVCYVAQQAVMLPGSVELNLRASSLLHRTVYDHKRAGELLSQFGLGGLDITKSAADLSGGEKMRIALIRTLLLRPKVLLLDETTASLDQHSKQRVEYGLLDLHRQEGTTQIWVTHDIEQARQISSRIWFMDECTLLEDAETAEFFQQPRTEAGRRFIMQPQVGQGSRRPQEEPAVKQPFHPSAGGGS